MFCITLCRVIRIIYIFLSKLWYKISKYILYLMIDGCSQFINVLNLSPVSYLFINAEYYNILCLKHSWNFDSNSF